MSNRGAGARAFGYGLAVSLALAGCGSVLGVDWDQAHVDVSADGSANDATSESGSSSGSDGASSEASACVPDDAADCMGKCGQLLDRCGKLTSCGACSAGQHCGGGGPNVCGTATCTPSCASKACGASDGCMGVCSMGSCPTGQQCVADACVCMPTCAGKACGASDGCGGTCQGACVTCDAGTLCAGLCVDTTSDASNCGSCGHSCVGGACTGSTCQPIVLTTVRAWGLYASGPNLYFTGNNGTIQVVPVAGGIPTVLGQVTLDGGLLEVNGLTLQGGTVYATGGTDVWSVSTAGGTPGLVASAPAGAPGPALAVAADSTHVYFTMNTDMAGGGSTGVCQAPSNGAGPVLQIGSLADPSIAISANPANVAVQGGFVYWASPGASDGTGVIMRVPIGGGSPQTIASSQAYPWALSVDATNVYWVNLGTTASGYTDGSVVKALLAGGGVQTLAMSSQLPSVIAIDSTHVYFAGTKTVNAVPIAGGPAVTMVTLTQVALALTADATSIYWSGKAGSIWRLAK